MAQPTPPSDQKDVWQYLTRVADATATLCLLPNQDKVPTAVSSNVEDLVRQIARNLLQASSPPLLQSPLPEPLVQLEQQKNEAKPKVPPLYTSNEPDDEERIPDWKTTRSDYLRSLLRGLPPIALDVAAQICSLLVSEGNISTNEAAAALSLFSKWLPIAPQLAPLVSDLFQLEMFKCPFEYGSGDEQVQLVMAEAAHKIYEFYAKRSEHSSIKPWWSWGHLIRMLIQDDDVVMKDTESLFDFQEAIRWHAARAIGYIIDLRPAAFAEYLDRLQVRTARVPWMPHPWIVDKEEERAQFRFLRGRVSLFDWKEDEMNLVSASQVRSVIPLHALLVHVGDGIVLVKNRGMHQLITSNNILMQQGGQARRRSLILTPATSQNLALLGAAMCSDPHPLPILVCGPPGSGKSSLVRELAHYCCASADDLLELHVDEETDSKTLIGSYTTTDIPGEFTWRPGALTQAVRSGKWVLMEDVDTVPMEIQAAIVQLLENRILPLGGGKFERCHSTFRLFGTCSTNPNDQLGRDSTDEMKPLRLAGKKLLNPSLWRKVHVQPLAFSELKQIGESLHPTLPSVVTEAALNILKVLDESGRADFSDTENVDRLPNDEAMVTTSSYQLTPGRHASVRDFLKLLSRISHTVVFEHNVSYATEAQRTLCLAETVDVFAASCPSLVQKKAFITKVAAPFWGITGELALNYIEARQPSITNGRNYFEIGRAKIRNTSHGRQDDEDTHKFAATNFSLRLMESIAVCITENESTLLVGETGCGKTSMLQQLARYAGRDLIVQNLSLQTDSTDLLGGYRPLEITHIARKVYLEFVDIFVATFSRKQNADFLKFTASMFEKKQWKRLAQCFTRAAALGRAKIKERGSDKHMIDPSIPGLGEWNLFSDRAEQFERQRLACASGLAFAFTEGALVDAIRTGKWVLLDEINLASSETLQRLCGLLDDSTGSVTLTERGDSHALKRHPDFRLFAAMNPATDAGKKDLPPSIRARFSELYVDELLDSVELRTVAVKYLCGVGSINGTSSEDSETSGRAVDIYLKCRSLAEEMLVDSSGHKPRYTMRTMCRALSATRNLALQQKLSLNRSMLEGFELAFEGALDTASSEAVQRVLRSHLGKRLTPSERDHPPRRPKSGREDTQYVLVKPFWLKKGPLDPLDWSEANVPGKSKFILTESMSHNLRRLSRAVAAGPWPVLLEGPTSAGKTTLIEYLASRCGHEVVRINNHEHTDVQEYTGGYSSDVNGSLSFQDGILVRALRRGHWVILDELNLAPSEVLEALNRLLDDNRELYLPEIDETVKPHPNFRLFATQNPSGAYGGRKPLSRAFRNRFVEIHMGDIPSDEMKTILEKRCSCPPSHAKALVKIMIALRQRRNAHGVFLGKDGLITPRDLLRWAERGGSSKLALAQEGYMLLAERLRNDAEKAIVKEEIESHLKVTIDCDDIYYGKDAEARAMLTKAVMKQKNLGLLLSSVAPTKSLLRLLTLVSRCVQQKEPVLLVGETGCGKTTVVQLLQEILDRDLHVINCHATTETSDLIGGLRPVRGRGQIANEIRTKFREFLSLYPDRDSLESTLRSSSDECIKLEGYFCDTCGGDDDDGLSEGSLKMILSSIESLWDRLCKDHEPMIAIHQGSLKKRKLDFAVSLGICHDQTLEPEVMSRLKELIVEIKVLALRHASLFEWADGPLVNAMRSGQLLLLDEMSLAEDAVLERLNPVLEPSRTLVLAEKGTDAFDENSSNKVVGHDNFRIFATMNPGGDFGKRELSPALRSRFTEIWVPQVTDPSDIEMVLDRTLTSVSIRFDRDSLKTKILNYVNFFNVTICGDKASPCSELELSLRDVLSWARFVVDVSNSNKDMDPWTLFCHGACLMHLDGLGLGTGLSSDDANSAKKKATSFLLDEVPMEARPRCNDTLSKNSHRALVTEDQFGMYPFTIETGSYPKPNSTFDFEAPTPSLNLLRVLRAMQISKPILLEGSPGVGKTSLAAGLAAASGNRLVRINLSEQTDMSDLMGSDLPNVDHNTNAGVSQAASSFRWCDGVLLRAIKQGDWVLLDELNLASQSVLEGLNSVLDHRASVYIPELGQTFHCPPTFRVFAAQNPLAQGGGRKGLPKSFLNRFTKVYIESLTDGDLHSIVSARFPSVPASMASSMIRFNKKIHEEVVEWREYGDFGSPWEFNLRDVFRWCELAVANGDTKEAQLARFAKYIYLERFRTTEDRKRLDSSYQEYFGCSLLELPPTELRLTDKKVNIGSVVLERLGSSVDASSGQLFGENSLVVRSLLGPIEAVATCITMKWPCLLVGLSGSGKSSTLNSLAELCNASLIHVSLTPSTDVNELVGSFEQVDSGEDHKEARQLLSVIHNAAVTYLTASQQDILLQEKLFHVSQSFDRGSMAEIAEAGREIESLLASASNRNNEFRCRCQTYLEKFRLVLKRIDSDVRGTEERDNGHFRWVDGILVTAMKRGYWLHLENVNLCPASVLDRLNPVMEKDGELLLTECAVKDSASNGTNHEVVPQHPHFRVFLSMNPENGEISRAMRNRCVEISLLSSCVGDASAFSPKALVDRQDALFATGIRSMRLATFMLELHKAEITRASCGGADVPSSKHIREWGRLAKGLYSRGLDAHFSLQTSCRLAYEFSKEQLRVSVPRSEIQQMGLENSALLKSPSIRWDFSFHPSQAELELDTCLIKLFAGWDQAPLNLKALLPIANVIIDRTQTESRLALDNKYQPDWFPTMQWNLLALYFGRACAVDFQARSRTLDGYSDVTGDYLRFMASRLNKVITVATQSSEPNGIALDHPLQDDCVFAVHLHRMAQFVREQATYGRVASLDSKLAATKEMSAIEVSWCLSEGKMDRATVSCPATTLLYPIFCAFDKWIYNLIMSVPEMVSLLRRQSLQLEGLLQQRDQMWLCLQQCKYEGLSPSNLLAFEESGFVVQWTWLKKRLLAFAAGSPLVSVQEPSLNKLKQQLDTLVVAIDRVLFNTGDGLSRSSDTLWKKGGHPLVPRQASQWEAMSLLEQESNGCILMAESSHSVVELQKLIDSRSPILFVDMKDKAELLAALCMCFWTSTDEVQRQNDTCSSQEIQKVSEAISKDLAQRRLSFEEKVHASRIDIEISTIENMLDVEKLSSLREGVTRVNNGGDENDFLRSLLLRFAKIQVSPLAEFWCVREEAALIGILAEILVTTSEDLDSTFEKVRSLEPRFRFFVDVVLSHTCLSVADIRPYQSLLWVVGDSDVRGECLVHLLRCIIPRMMDALSRHLWVNSFNDLNSISDRLEMPKLWLSDERNVFEDISVGESDKGVNESRWGPPGLYRHVKTEVIFRFVAPDVSSMFNIANKSTYVTIENHSAREKQARTVLTILSSLKLSPQRQHDLYQVLYLFAQTIEALHDFFPGESARAILSFLRDLEALQSVDQNYAFRLFADCEHSTFRKCLDSAVYPLFMSLQSISRDFLPEKNQSLARVYVGLLRMNLLAPCSPLDPGKKPIAKAAEHGRYLKSLREKATAIQLDSLFIQGIPAPNDPYLKSLLSEMKRIEGKRSKQELKMIERVASAPPYIDFFRESRRFSQATSAAEGVAAVVGAISQAAQDVTSVRSARTREQNWQATSGSFCSRLLSHYAPYEDVVLPFVNAIQNIRDGVRLLADLHLCPSEPNISLDSLLEFPMGNQLAFSNISWILPRIGTFSLPSTSRPADLKRSRFALSLALLSRMDLRKRLRGGTLTLQDLAESHSVFSSVASAWSLERDGSTNESTESPETLLEEGYREQFPDHGQEFHSLLSAIEMEDASDQAEVEQSETIDEEDWSLAEDQIATLCSLHRDLYLNTGCVVNDQCRTRVLCSAYIAAYHLSQTWPVALAQSSDNTEQVGAHIMTLALCSAGLSKSVIASNGNVIDFHRDANPAEVTKATRPLDALILRISQLLSAFPGHSVLIALVRVADHVRKLPLSTTSVGKAMHGLEIILQKAQAWEQHASCHVKLGSSLQNISELVACWRKLELQSWGTLLEGRSLRFANRARRHWPRLYNLLAKETEHNLIDSKRNHCSVVAPIWVWKGLRTGMGPFLSSSGQCEVGGAMTDLCRVMDTFLLSSPLGEFNERLKLIETFAFQMTLMSEHSENGSRSSIGRMLFSLVSFYKQFVPLLETRLTELRHPIEARLKDEVKLAKWDEQSYYALQDSTERNHRKLMKLLREYDDVLELSVSSILERNLCHGIRSIEASNEEPCSSIPAYRVLFPFVEQASGTTSLCSTTAASRLLASVVKWADPEKEGILCDKYVSRMGHYAKRLSTILGSSKFKASAWSYVGSDNVNDLCETIFDRIESLRKENTTKTMKQRALVDLFKTLKNNGYLQTKWSVPPEVREMAHLFQLPGFITSNNSLPTKEVEVLCDAERYFQRTTAEVNRLRSEVSVLGSKHMSQRETHIMLSFAENGLMMLCQQRCVLAKLLKQVSHLDDLTESCETWHCLPVGQTKLNETLQEFNDACLSVEENLKQLQLLMKTSSPLVEGKVKVETTRDLISITETCISRIQAHKVLIVSKVLTHADIARASEAGAALEDIGRFVRDSQNSCEKSQCLPPEVFNSCISEINRACSILSRLSGQASSGDNVQKGDSCCVMSAASLVIQKVLLAVQTVFRERVTDNGADDDHLEDAAIFSCHALASKELAAMNLDDVIEAASTLTQELLSLHESDRVPQAHRNCCTSVVSGAHTFARSLSQVSKQRLSGYLVFARSLAKLNYVLVRVFRVLVSKGYCADNITNDEDGDGEGDISGMNFEDDKEGTGMGEGDGKQDVTDQLESEEQLLGLKGDDQDDTTTEQRDSRELNEEEAKQGMEMEADFEGDMFDVLEQNQDDIPDPDDDEEQELDREMGDGPDQNEDVVDEKMWDQSDDDEGEQDPADEKFEKDSGMKGQSLEDEVRTREEDEAQKGPDATKDESNEAKSAENEDIGADKSTLDKPEINDDLEDNYEEKAPGIDVRDEHNEADQGDDNGNDGDEAMELEDNLNLDENDDGETEKGEDAMETEDHQSIEETPQDEDGTANSGRAGEDEDGESDSDSSEFDDNHIESGGHKGDGTDEGEKPPEDENGEDIEMPEVEFSRNESAPQDMLGVQSKDGKDDMTENIDESQEDDTNGMGDKDNPTNANEQSPQAQSGGTSGVGEDAGSHGESSPADGATGKETESASAPNPFQSPGDATKFWHKKLRMLEGNIDDLGEESEERNDDVNENGDGEFEFSSRDQDSSNQVLGKADEEEAARIEELKEEENQGSQKEDANSQEGKERPSENWTKWKNSGQKSGTEKQTVADEEEMVESDSEPKADDDMEVQELKASDDESVGDAYDAVNKDDMGNRVVTDLSQLNANGSTDSLSEDERRSSLVQDDAYAMTTGAEVATARSHWSEIQAETHHLARRLCEKLRLVMEPLVATKLKGDYRTGKRINMKRVIGYIASGYRKDKIWLRRTKPAKRNYRVLLAVDNSESMHKSGAGEMALAAMATLAVGMSQLEIGELGVASFGEEMRLLHPFHQPFTPESGVNVVQNFPFDEKRTRTALCVESAMSALQSQGDSASMQLVFMISDGRIERDSRDELRRLVREMMERNVLLVMIVVEGNKNGPAKTKDSIVHMKEVTFKNGKPNVRQFIEDYPFPYYMVLEDMQSLPELLGTALSQWFEMLAQIQVSSR